MFSKHQPVEQITNLTRVYDQGFLEEEILKQSENLEKLASNHIDSLLKADYFDSLFVSFDDSSAFLTITLKYSDSEQNSIDRVRERFQSDFPQLKESSESGIVNTYVKKDSSESHFVNTSCFRL